MKSVNRKVFALVLIVVLLAGSLLTYNSVHAAAASKTKIDTAVFHDAMRKLWEDHITWTRLYIVSAVADLPDKDATAGRLLQNQTDIGNAVKAFYGDAAGDQLTSLLKDHILIAAELIDAAKKGDSAAVADAKERWYENADQIAAFLNSANPDHWSLADMQSMMHSHLDLTLQEAVDRLNGNYTADIADYEAVHGEILQMADMLSMGIVEQFPQMFNK